MKRRKKISTEKGNVIKKTKRIRSTAVIIHDRKILGYRGEDPESGRTYFFLPGGAIEPGESAAQSAVRETLEETGYSVEIARDTEIISHYDFNWNGKIYDCETWFYLGSLLAPPSVGNPPIVQDAPYHRGVQWLDVEMIEQAFSYNDEILSAVGTLVNRHVERTSAKNS